MIDEFVKQHSTTAVAHTSLGQLRYLSTVRYVDAVVGNSSSGIIEAPCFNIPTVNIGDRQRGRIMSETVTCCSPHSSDIRTALSKALQFDKEREYNNPYGDGHASERIITILKTTKEINLKKSFFDVPFNHAEF